MLHDPEHKKTYAAGGRTKVPIFVKGVVKVDNAKIAVLDSDLGSVETEKKYVLYLPSISGVFIFIVFLNIWTVVMMICVHTHVD